MHEPPNCLSSLILQAILAKIDTFRPTSNGARPPWAMLGLPLAGYVILALDICLMGVFHP